MSRRGSAKPTGIQMFPFLAVLICTMGALVVLLHAFARHGQAQAAKIAEAKARAQQQEDEIDADFFHWRVEHLREAREKTQAQLADERLKLSHVEEHERRLLKKLEQLKITATELERTISATAEEKDSNAAELAETQAALAEAREAVAKARQNGKFKAVNYSVVPFEGRNATNRRPIYIECRENQIILQPEGVELTPQDFIGFFGPGNPLASALRAQREYFAERAPNGSLPVEPYPLMLVRPDGIAAYYAARAALDSWGSEFGYELVGADWDLKFPERDEKLAELTQLVVDEARQRHREYVLSSSQVARRRSRPVYHAKSNGGFEKEPGTGDGPRGSGLGSWDDYQDDWRSSSGGGGPRGMNSPGRFGDQPNGNSPGGLDEYEQYGNVPSADPYAEPGEIAPRLKDNGGHGPGSKPTVSGAEFAEMGRGGKSGYGLPSEHEGIGEGLDGAEGTGTGGNPEGTQRGAEAENSQPGGTPHGDSATAQAADGKPGEAKPMGDSCPNGECGSADGKQSMIQMPYSKENQKPQGPIHSGASASVPPARYAPHGKKPGSLAEVRGNDWGLSGGGMGAVAASRPILVQCFSDRLVIVPESRSQSAREIKFGDRTQDSVDELVSAVWEHMKVWGQAGRGLYWRPTLILEVRPGAEERFEDLKALMANSGLDVDRRNRPRSAQAQPSASQTPRR